MKTKDKSRCSGNITIGDETMSIEVKIHTNADQFISNLTSNEFFKMSAIEKETYLAKSVSIKPALYKYIPEDLMTETIWASAIKGNPGILPNADIQTPSMCMAAVKKDGLALMYCKIKNQDIVEAAVRQNGLAIRMVPDYFITTDIIMSAIRTNSKAISMLKDMDVDLAEECVRINPQPYKFLDSSFKTKDISIIAVSNDGRLIDFCPNLERKILEAASISSPEHVIKSVDNLPLDIVQSIVSVRGDLLCYVKDPSGVTCIKALSNNLDAIEYVPESVLEEIVKLAALSLHK